MIPPNDSYYAVIFTSKLKPESTGYSEMVHQMESLVKKQDGFLGMETAREDIGITVSYWRDEDSIKNWKDQIEHQVAQEMGRTQWYEWYNIRVCKIEREYAFNSSK